MAGPFVIFLCLQAVQASTTLPLDPLQSSQVREDTKRPNFNFWVKNLLPIDSCPQNFNTEVTLLFLLLKVGNKTFIFDCLLEKLK
jgi:hypothetical protein